MGTQHLYYSTCRSTTSGVGCSECGQPRAKGQLPEVEPWGKPRGAAGRSGARGQRKRRRGALPCPGSTVALQPCLPGQIVNRSSRRKGGHFSLPRKSEGRGGRKRREKNGSAPPRWPAERSPSALRRCFPFRARCSPR